MQRYDVVVAGGGSAGLAAAVSSARRGAKTLLIERHNVLGGQAPLALIHSVCGLYRLATDSEPLVANHGFPMEWAGRLMRAGAASGPARLGRVWVLLTQPRAIPDVAAALVRETPHLDVRLDAPLAGADDGELSIVSTRGTEKVRASTMVDATGDAALAALLGAPCEQAPPSQLQRPAFIVALAEVDAAPLEGDGPLRLAHRLAHAVREGRLPAGALGASFRAAITSGEAFLTIDLDGGDDYDPLSPACVARQAVAGRALATQVIEFLRAEAPGFEHCRLAAEPSLPGIRESRRVVGQYQMQADDLLRGARFDDAVAAATWPMELRETAQGARMRYPEHAEPCEVPLRALRFRDHARCFVAGRCLSASHDAQASLRVIGTCLATGQAAGVAAAMLALEGACDAAAIRAHCAR